MQQLHPDVIRNSISVDGSCFAQKKEKTGKMKYQVKCNQTFEVLYSMSHISGGTSSISEFLALVEGLKYIHSRPNVIVYSDNEFAIYCVTKQKYREKVKIKNHEVSNLIKTALVWIKENNPDLSRVLKWNTVKWGQIPADYGHSWRYKK